MKHEHTRTFEQQARIAARHQEFHVVPADWCPACRALKAEDAEREEQELRAEYEEAVETVYAGRTFPEYACREHGHGDCAFTERGACTGEQIDRQIGRMRDKAAERTLLPPHPKGNFSPEALAEKRQHPSLRSHIPALLAASGVEEKPRADRYTRPGAVLKNGARVIAYRNTGDYEGVVFALTQGMAGHAYATWTINLKTGDTFSGHYSDDFLQAVDDFGSRRAY